jgi:hypothetical protein
LRYSRSKVRKKSTNVFPASSGLPERRKLRFAVDVIAINILAAIAARGDVIDATGSFEITGSLAKNQSTQIRYPHDQAQQNFNKP